ncbi:hypothetical protein [Aquimarina longa]|uniref:hypothetical protein n=1 Tax=Aquimarina longa TaxID=1080221 RepID=UPI0007827BE3|nr:hypothetical protein [Aquimarina longa]
MVYLIYKTDNWHSYNSREVIGVCFEPESVIKTCKEQAKKEGEKIKKNQLFNLQTYNQTQGYEGEGEFHFESVDTNTLL